jgi:pilus assembly protein CpaF
MIERLSEAVVRSGVPLERPSLGDDVRRIARVEAPLATAADIEGVVDSLVGMGVLEGLLRDPAVSDVLVNGPSDIWVERGGVLTRTGVAFSDGEAIVAAVERAIAPLGLRFDRASPMVDARLPDGSRLHAVMPPASVEGPVVAIRRFVAAVSTLDEMVEASTMSGAQRRRLCEVVRTRRNVVVAGGTGAGKTTLLNALSSEIPSTERVVVIEDAAELRLGGHVVRLEARAANAEGKGAIPIETLLRSALRLRPDRIVLGEVRGPEALDLVSALNTGHAGSMSTVHANSCDEALWRLETLALSGERLVSAESVNRQIDRAVHVVVQLERDGPARRVVEIRERL